VLSPHPCPLPLYLFTVGSTGDSPVPSGDPPDGTERGIERNNAVFPHSGYTTTPPGESPGGAGGSPAPPSVTTYLPLGEGQGEGKRCGLPSSGSNRSWNCQTGRVLHRARDFA